MTQENLQPLRAALLLTLLCLIAIALSGWGFWELSHIWWPTAGTVQVQPTEKSLLAREKNLLRTPERPAPHSTLFRMDAPQVLSARPGELAVALHPENEPQYRFVGMPLDELAQLVAGWTGLNYRPDPDVQGTVNRTYDFGDPLQLLSDASKDVGYEMRMLGQQIFLDRPIHDSTKTKVYVKVLKNFRPPDNISLIGGGPNRGILLDSSENQMEELLRGILSPTAFIRYEGDRHLVTATDSEGHIRLLNALLDKLDRGQPMVTVAISIYEVKIEKFKKSIPDWDPVLKRFGGAKAYKESIVLMNRVLSGEDVTGSLVPTSRHGVILPSDFTSAVLSHTESLGLVTLRTQFFCTSSLDKSLSFTQNRRDFFEAEDDPPNGSPNLFPLDVSTTIIPGATAVLRIAPSISALKSKPGEKSAEAVTTTVPIGRSFVLGGVADSLIPGVLKWTWNVPPPDAQNPPPPGGVGMPRDKDIILVAEPIVFDPTDALSIDASIRWLRRIDDNNLFTSDDPSFTTENH